MRIFLYAVILFLTPTILLTQPKQEVKLRLSDINTYSPRATLYSFMNSMQLYRQGVKEGNFEKENKIKSAIRCLDLDGTPYMLREEKGREIAIYLKEVIDRIDVVKYSEVPDKPEENLWKFKDTEIVLVKVTAGERTGEWLFSKDTAYRAKEFYDKVKDLPYVKGSGQGAGYEPPMLATITPRWAQKVILGSYLWQWLGLLVAILFGYLLKYVGRLLLFVLMWIANKTKTEWDNKIMDAIKNPGGYLLAIGFWFLCISYLRIDGTLLKVLSFFLQMLFGYSLTWLFYNLSSIYSEYVESKYTNEDSHFKRHILPLIGKTIKVTIVILGSLMIIQNMGFNIMSLLAGLGIGGLAFALAAKDTAANLFGSLMILFDKPFKAGDHIVVGSHEGFVEDIGLRSTRLRTFYDSVVSIPNSDMANARIDNMGLRQKRRILENISLAYNTDADSIPVFVEGIKKILMEDLDVWQDKLYVNFNKFNDSTLNIVIFFYVLIGDYGREIACRERIFVKIMQLAKSMNIEFAVPTRAIHLKQ
jgi:MscS family membrane protein